MMPSTHSLLSVLPPEKLRGLEASILKAQKPLRNARSGQGEAHMLALASARSCRAKQCPFWFVPDMCLPVWPSGHLDAQEIFGRQFGPTRLFPLTKAAA